MAERVVRLNPNRNFFSGGGLYLVNKVNPTYTYSNQEKVSLSIINAIKSGVLIDVNNNITLGNSNEEEIVESNNDLNIEEELNEEEVEEDFEDSNIENNNEQKKQGNRKYRTKK